MDIASSLLVPDWLRGSIRGNQGVVIAETGFKSPPNYLNFRSLTCPTGLLTISTNHNKGAEQGMASWEKTGGSSSLE
jgi:hypothetical protein